MDFESKIMLAVLGFLTVAIVLLITYENSLPLKQETAVLPSVNRVNKKMELVHDHTGLHPILRNRYRSGYILLELSLHNRVHQVRLPLNTYRRSRISSSLRVITRTGRITGRTTIVDIVL